MNFNFINELRIALDSSNIFQFTIIGAKALALALMLFNIIENQIQTFNNDNVGVKFGTLISIFAYAFLIVSSDWIVDIIENTFANVDVQMQSTTTDTYTQLMTLTGQRTDEILNGAEDWMDYIGVFFGSIYEFIMLIIVSILAGLMKIADMSMTAGYLVIRLFLIELMKFIFPIVIALSTLNMTKDLLARWIKKYIGLFVLGIAYIGIIRFMELVGVSLLNQFSQNSEGDGLITLSNGLLVTICVLFTIKIKLFMKATSFIENFFS